MKFDVRILEDGTLSIDTDKIPAEVHASADKFLKELTALMGGPRETIQHRQTHVHEHGEEHDHEHEHEH